MDTQTPAAEISSSSSSSISSSQVCQEEIDRLRSRVDTVLRNLVQGSEADTVSLKNQLHSLRGSPNTTSLVSGVSVGSNGTSGSDEFTSAGTVQIGNTTTNSTLYPFSSSDKRWIVDPYGDQGEYVGETNPSKLPHGIGIMKYSDGRVYQGGWKNGQWHGEGRASFSNGDMFMGLYHEDQRHGQGWYKWSDGREFKGGFVNDQRSGHGIYKWPDGAMYVGEFQNGLRSGEGTYTFHDGSVYSGEWQKGKYHGSGECRWTDGRVYKGNWVEGKASGYGVEIRPDGSIRHDGQWEDDKPIRNHDNDNKSNSNDDDTGTK